MLLQLACCCRVCGVVLYCVAGALKRTLAAAVQLRVAPKVAAAGGLQERLQAAVSNAADATVTQTMLLQSVCEAAVSAIKQSASDGMLT
jgi:NADH:ubiquinone oxidoreductase subunit H